MRSSPSEYNILSSGNTLSRKSRLYELSPFIDENGIMRLSGRLSQSNIAYNSKFPIILDNKSRHTSLLIEFYHQSMMHCGITFIMSTIRKKYWVLKCRRTIKSIIRNCQKCKRFHIEAVEQPYAPLVDDRVASSHLRPFESNGLDYTGPFFKNSCDTYRVD